MDNARAGLGDWELTPLERAQRVLRRLNRSLRDAGLEGWEAILGDDGGIYIRLTPRQADIGWGELTDRLQGCQLEHIPVLGQQDFFDLDADWFPPGW